MTHQDLKYSSSELSELINSKARLKNLCKSTKYAIGVAMVDYHYLEMYKARDYSNELVMVLEWVSENMKLGGSKIKEKRILDLVR